MSWTWEEFPHTSKRHLKVARREGYKVVLVRKVGVCCAVWVTSASGRPLFTLEGGSWHKEEESFQQGWDRFSALFLEGADHPERQLFLSLHKALLGLTYQSVWFSASDGYTLQIDDFEDPKGFKQLSPILGGLSLRYDLDDEVIRIEHGELPNAIPLYTSLGGEDKRVVWVEVEDIEDLRDVLVRWTNERGMMLFRR